MIHFRHVHDISIRLGVESASWPGDPPYERRLVSSFEDGSASVVSQLSMTTHIGTHVDTPAHFIKGGRGLDAYSPADFILAAVVADAEGVDEIGPKLVKDTAPPGGGAILFRTSNSASKRIASGEFFKDGAYLSPEAAQACVDFGVRMVGIDYFTIDRFGSDGFPAHMKLLSAGVLILETVNLARVKPGAYTLVCLPLRIAGAEASPVRAVLLE